MAVKLTPAERRALGRTSRHDNTLRFRATTSARRLEKIAASLGKRGRPWTHVLGDGR